MATMDRVRKRGEICRFRLLSAVVLVMAAVPNAVEAQCVISPLKHKNNSDVVAAFVGSVHEIQTVPVGQIVTFIVSRVYKGQIDERVVVHFQKQTRGDTEGLDAFEQGRPYLVLAHRLTAQERVQFMLPADGGEKLGVGGCRAHPASSDWLRQVLGRAQGYVPRQRPR